MQKYFCSIFLLFAINFSSAQSSWKSFWKISCPEKFWIITHPFVAKKAFRISLEARSVSEKMLMDSLLDKDPSGGQIDAFRHAYWMARLSQTMCWRKAISLGKAHEKGEYRKFKKGQLGEENDWPDSISGAMDLYNNGIGVEIGRKNMDADTAKMGELVKSAVKSGEMKIISKNIVGLALDCDGKIVNTVLYFHRWNIPKCLVRSDFPHVK